MKEYEIKSSTKNFGKILPLIDEDAVYSFTEGSYNGIDQIRHTFERTWSTIKEETYTIENLKWIANCEHTAVCVYEFHSDGMVMRGVGFEPTNP